MFKSRNLILAATAATIALGGYAAASSTPAQAGLFNKDRGERVTLRERRAEKRAHRTYRKSAKGTKHYRGNMKDRKEARMERRAERRYKRSAK